MIVMVVLKLLAFFLIIYGLMFLFCLRIRFRLDAMTAIIALVLTILVSIVSLIGMGR